MTDAITGAGVADGSYSLGNLDVRVHEGTVRGPRHYVTIIDTKRRGIRLDISWSRDALVAHAFEKRGGGTASPMNRFCGVAQNGGYFMVINYARISKAPCRIE